MKVIYVSGPYRASNAWDREQNIRRAEALALEVWKLGAAALCPHTNTRFFDGAAPDAVWLKGDLELLFRCDAVILTPDWRQSEGARAEHTHAVTIGLPVFEGLGALKFWLQKENDHGTR